MVVLNRFNVKSKRLFCLLLLGREDGEKNVVLAFKSVDEDMQEM
jgi:hypothetical protein